MTPRYPVNIVRKTWGHEVWLVNNEHYCGKILHFHKGASGSLHYHKNKHETFFVQRGRVKIELQQGSPERVEYELYEGQAIDIPAWTAHRVMAIEDTELLEFSTHHEDGDTYRIQAA